MGFQHKKEGDIFSSQYFIEDGRDLWLKLPTETIKDFWVQWDFRPHDDFNISGNSGIENGLYLGLIWKLCSDYPFIYGIPSWYSKDVVAKFKEPIDWVENEYSMELVDKKGKPPSFRSGFFPVRAPFEFKKAGVFAIKDFQELADFQKLLLMDACAEYSLYLLGSDRIDRIISILNSGKKIRMKDLLEGKDIFIHHYLGMDMGYPDGIEIHSKMDVSEKIDGLTEDYGRKISAYQASYGQIDNMDKFFQAMQTLVDVN